MYYIRITSNETTHARQGASWIQLFPSHWVTQILSHFCFSQTANPAGQPRTCFAYNTLFQKTAASENQFMERRRKRQKACMIYNLFFHWASLCLLRTRLFSPSKKLLTELSQARISVMCNNFEDFSLTENEFNINKSNEHFFDIS